MRQGGGNFTICSAGLLHSGSKRQLWRNSARVCRGDQPPRAGRQGEETKTHLRALGALRCCERVCVHTHARYAGAAPQREGVQRQLRGELDEHEVGLPQACDSMGLRELCVFGTTEFIVFGSQPPFPPAAATRLLV